MQHLPAILAIAGGIGLIFNGFGFFGFMVLCFGGVLAIADKALPAPVV